VSRFRVAFIPVFLQIPYLCRGGSGLRRFGAGALAGGALVGGAKLWTGLPDMDVAGGSTGSDSEF
jgi:hypothetical protein